MSAFSTRVKHGLNSLLQPIGLQIATTLADRREIERLRELQNQGHWRTPRYSEGLRFSGAKHLEFLEATCSSYRSDYSAFAREPDPVSNGFYLHNKWFESVDAEVLYSTVRHFRPQQVIEIGSGFSTRIIRRAIADEDLKTRLTCIDPQPRVDIGAYADEHIASTVEGLEWSAITERLSENDILFIDSSHRIAPGGDVPYLFLEVLPRLKTKVLVHVHDIFLPFDYPEEQVVVFQWKWTEQYLLHAFLAFNNSYDLLWPGHYMWNYHKSEILSCVPNVIPSAVPSSFWLTRVR